MPLGTEEGLGPDDIVLDEDPAPPSPKRGRSPSPIFSQFLLWPNGWMDQDDTWHGGGPWSKGHILLDKDPATLPKRGHSPQFSVNLWATVCKTVLPMLSDRCLSVCLSCLFVTLVYCGQTVGRIKMKLVMQVGLVPGHIVLDGDPATPHPKGNSHPNFRPIYVAAKWLHGSRCHLVRR